MKDGSGFAGEYSVIQFGCGTGCTSVVVANNRTGQLFSFPRGGEFNQGLTLEFNVNSNLMVARWYTDSFGRPAYSSPSYLLTENGSRKTP